MSNCFVCRDLFTKSLTSDVNSAPRLTSLAPGALLVLPQVMLSSHWSILAIPASHWSVPSWYWSLVLVKNLPHMDQRKNVNVCTRRSWWHVFSIISLYLASSSYVFVNIPLFQSFGNIYLGETFSSYVCVHNDSTEVCSSVSVRWETTI